MSNKKVFFLVSQALVAGLYVCLTLVVSPLSYGNFQFRFSEVLVILAFYNPTNIIGLTLGCFIANLFSPMLIYDITLGVAATLISLVFMSKTKKLIIACIYPIIFNGLLVGLELYLAYSLPFFISALEVAVGELGVMVVGYIVFKIMEKNKKLMYVITDDKKFTEQTTDFYKSISSFY